MNQLTKIFYRINTKGDTLRVSPNPRKQTPFFYNCCGSAGLPDIHPALFLLEKKPPFLKIIVKVMGIVSISPHHVFLLRNETIDLFLNHCFYTISEKPSGILKD